MEMKKNNLENKNDDVCEVFDSHDDVVERVKERIPDENEFAELSEFFKIFGNPTRLKIISLLSLLTVTQKKLEFTAEKEWLEKEPKRK